MNNLSDIKLSKPFAVAILILFGTTIFYQITKFVLSGTFVTSNDMFYF